MPPHRAGCTQSVADAADAAADADDDAANELPTGQLPSLAAAHPEAYTALMDCFLRAPVMHAADMVAAGQMVRQAAVLLDSDAFLGNTVAVAGLASAITSLFNRAVQFVKDACSIQQQQQQLVAEPSQLAAACYPAAVWVLVRDIVAAFSSGVWGAAMRIARPASQNSSDRSSSSSASQAAASAALLAVVLARSLVQVADAMQAAGPQLLFECQRREAAFLVKWAPGGQVHGLAAAAVVPPGNAAQQTVRTQWQFWQLGVLHTMQPLMSALATLSIVEPAGDAEDRAAAGAAAGPDGTTSSSSSGQAPSASSSGSSRSKWGHLLQLRRFSADWVAAMKAFSDKRPGWGKEVDRAWVLLLAGTPPAVDVQMQFDDVLQLIRELVDAVPLPVVCNNPSCESLAGVSEAAAACKACSECRCRYCSVDCQKADWKRHKPACKRMAAAGMTCA
jgi:hypothetical protein